MSTDEDAVLIMNPLSGERLTYGELRRAVAAGEGYFPVCRPKGAIEAVRALLLALLWDQPLALYDPLLSVAELAAVGERREALASEVPLSGVALPDVASMIARAEQARNFRLTLLTSGSTGLPKQVTHGIGTLARAVRRGGDHASAVWALVYNPTHIAAVQVVLQAFFNRNTIIDCYLQTPDQVAEAIHRQGVTHVSATPSFYRLLLPGVPPQTGVCVVTLGGERGDARLIERLQKAFPKARIRNIYASTEAGTVLSADGDTFGIPDDLRDRVRIRNGQVEIHESLLGRGTQAHLADAWYGTGDKVEIVSENPLRFRFAGRDREWVNIGGEKVDPSEVEDALLAHPHIKAARVFGRANSVLGTILCAEVQASVGLDEGALRAALAQQLHPVKIPRYIRFVDELPQGRTGKRLLS